MTNVKQLGAETSLAESPHTSLTARQPFTITSTFQRPMLSSIKSSIAKASPSSDADPHQQHQIIRSSLDKNQLHGDASDTDPLVHDSAPSPPFEHHVALIVAIACSVAAQGTSTERVQKSSSGRASEGLKIEVEEGQRWIQGVCGHVRTSSFLSTLTHQHGHTPKFRWRVWMMQLYWG